jgi:hypothetical protein
MNAMQPFRQFAVPANAPTSKGRQAGARSMRALTVSLLRTGRTMSRRGVLFALAIVPLTAGLSPVHGQADLFADYCKTKLSDVQQDRRLCVVGIVQDDRHLQVIAATQPDLVGRVVAVYQSRIVQQIQSPLRGLAGDKGRIVAVGGFASGPDLYVARRL